MKVKKWLYFRTVADEDNDSIDTTTLAKNSSPPSICVPADGIRGMSPVSDTVLRINIENTKVYEDATSSQRTAYTGSDYVELNVTAGKIFEVIETISMAINASQRHNDGFIVVADDATTLYDNTTTAATYLSPHITSCGTIGSFNQPQGVGMHEYYEVVTPMTADDNDVAASLTIKLPAQAIVLEAAMTSLTLATSNHGSVALELWSAAIADDAASGGTEFLGADSTGGLSIPDADLDISSDATANSTIHSGTTVPVDTATLFSSATAVSYMHVTAKEDMSSMTGTPEVGVYIKWWGGPATTL